MTSKASSPGKVILFGEHFVVYGIRAILCAIDKRIFVEAEKTNDSSIKIKSEIGEISIDVNDEKLIESPLKPLHYLATKMIQEYDYDGGIKISVKSDIPIGVGLGSSSACCVAGAAAIANLFGKKSRDDILRLAIDAEKTIFQNTSGADCTVCTFGGLMQYDRRGGFSKINSSPNFHLVVANSKISHSTDIIVSNVKKFKENNENEFLELCKKESSLIDKVLGSLNKNNLPELGKYMLENQKYLEQIGVSNQKLQDMIDISKKESFGGKITGAGGGGCIISLTDDTNVSKTMNAFQKNGYECFSVKIDFVGLDNF